jgi:hypothetical protein
MLVKSGFAAFANNRNQRGLSRGRFMGREAASSKWLSGRGRKRKRRRGEMAFSHIKIKAADHGSKSEVWVDGVKPPGLFSVSFQSDVDSATVATLKMFTTVEAEDDSVQVRKIVVCPGCHEVHKGAMLAVNVYAKVRKRLLGIFHGIQFLNGKIKRKDVTEMGDTSRKYIPS